MISMHGILSGDSALEKNKAGTRGRSAQVLIRTNRKGLTERVASEQGSEGRTSSPAGRCPRERHCIEKASCQAHEGGRFLACSRVSRRARR